MNTNNDIVDYRLEGCTIKVYVNAGTEKYFETSLQFANGTIAEIIYDRLLK